MKPKNRDWTWNSTKKCLHFFIENVLTVLLRVRFHHFRRKNIDLFRLDSHANRGSWVKRNNVFFLWCAVIYSILFLACAKKDRLTNSTLCIKIEPGAASLDAGAKQEFRAWGVNEKSETIDISPVWQVEPSALGTLSVAQGSCTVFTAAGSGLGTISAYVADAAAEIEVAVKDANGTIPADVFGIYSETDQLKLLIDTDSAIGVFSSNASFDEAAFDDITTDKKEGVYAKQTTVTVPATTAYAGWFIQWGTTGSLDTINMDYYKTGHLVFWIKTPVNLEVGIRSSNVNANINPAKVYLSNISGFAADNAWHEVSLPLTLFSNNVMWSIIKEFFIISAISDLGGTDNQPQTFYIDHIRWTKD